MEDSSRICPTRTDGRASLFAHKVGLPQCQERQRKSFHKCFTCAHNNNLQQPVKGPTILSRSKLELKP